MDRCTNSLTRRRFLAASTSIAAFSIVPRHVLGGPKHIPPSEKLNIAGIGIGGKGFSDLESVSSQNIVALCDVDFKHGDRAFKTYPNAKRYKDFRVMLDQQKDIDAVIVATPDHMHASISLTAMRMGKHVYCQKPLTQSVHQAQLMAAAAEKYGVATQMGNQGQASEETRRLAEFIADGAIGDVTEAHIWTDRPMKGVFDVYWPQGIGRPEEKPSVPDFLDWDLFLGVAPDRPYHWAYHPFNWRGWLDFGTGALGDIGCHAMDPVFRALKLDYPTSVNADSTRLNRETYPVASTVRYKFPKRDGFGPLSLTWYDGGLKPSRPEELEDGRQMGTNGKLLIGTKGKMLDGRIIPQSKMKGCNPPKTLPRSPGHYQEWINACKGGPKPGSNFDFAGRLTEVVLMGNIALRPELKETLMRKDLNWDPVAKQFTNVPEANEFLKAKYRKGWESTIKM